MAANNDQINSGNEELDKKISQWMDWDKVRNYYGFEILEEHNELSSSRALIYYEC